MANKYKETISKTHNVKIEGELKISDNGVVDIIMDDGEVKSLDEILKRMNGENIVLSATNKTEQPIVE